MLHTLSPILTTKLQCPSVRRDMLATGSTERVRVRPLCTRVAGIARPTLGAVLGTSQEAAGLHLCAQMAGELRLCAAAGSVRSTRVGQLGA